jgi:hypothetical protein
MSAGEETTHSHLAHQAWRREGREPETHIPPIRAGNDPDSLMEGGLALRPQHYIGFLEALTNMTHTRIGDWEIDPL